MKMKFINFILLSILLVMKIDGAEDFSQSATPKKPTFKELLELKKKEQLEREARMATVSTSTEIQSSSADILPKSPVTQEHIDELKPKTSFQLKLELRKKELLGLNVKAATVSTTSIPTPPSDTLLKPQEPQKQACEKSQKSSFRIALELKRKEQREHELRGASESTNIKKNETDMFVFLGKDEYEKCLRAELEYCKPKTNTSPVAQASPFQNNHDRTIEEVQQQIILDRALAEILQAEANPFSGIIAQDDIDRIVIAISDDNNVLKQFCGNFKAISGHVLKIPNNHDVHILDDYVFGGQSQIVNLLTVGKHLTIDTGDFTWTKIQEELLKMLPKADEDIISDYEQTKITVGMLKGHIATYFTNLPNELAGFFSMNPIRCDQVRELWSRVISLTTTLDLYDPAFLAILAQCISENYLTQGGCIQGRINRIFLRYVSLLGAAGINETIEIVEALSK